MDRSPPGMMVESVPPRPESVRRYATKVFRESSFGAVSAILSERNPCRRAFRTAVMVAFTASFIYQCVTFFGYLCQYPTVVNIEIRTPKSFLAPAITFCNNNLIKRKLFCDKYPDYCIQPDKSLCEGNSATCPYMVVKDEVLMNISKVVKTHYEILDLNALTEDFFYKKISEEFLEGKPKPFLLPRNEEKTLSNMIPCYRLNDRVDNGLTSFYSQADINQMKKSSQLVYRVRPDDMLNPRIKPGIFFSVHSPFIAGNPPDDGIFMLPGKMYRVVVTMEEENLLPHPYQTNCMNYTEMWLKNGKSGPRSQEGCQNKCLNDMSIKYVDCNIYQGNPEDRKRICNDDDLYHLIEYVTSAEDEASVSKPCHTSCKDDCWKVKFNYKVLERHIIEVMHPNASNTEEEIQVYLDIDDSEIFSLCYRPQFQPVEAFSYVGGFIGIWLGVSLVQVADLVESLFRIVFHFCRRRSCKNSCQRGQPDSV